MKADIAIVGGAGHIGLPLGILFANKRKKVILFDKDKKNIDKINNLLMPFMEEGGSRLLKENKKKIFYYRKEIFIKCKNNNNLYWYTCKKLKT